MAIRETPKAELFQGTLDLLILKALALAPNHGLGVSRRITQISGGAYQVGAGSLFPALHRLEEKGFVKAKWGTSENNRRAKFYRLTEAGTRRLEAEVREWERASIAIGQAIAAT
jgi:transcriptional regulator